MREIVDKHFADNWVISFFLGYTGGSPLACNGSFLFSSPD